MERDEVVDRSKIRLGLAMVSVAFIVALGLLLAIESGIGRAIMGLVMFTALVRAFLLTRSLRR